MRARETGLSDDALRACGLAYLSDFWLGGVVKGPHPEAVRQRLTSVDHAMWFHRFARADEWMLYVEKSPSAQGGRGLSLGRIYSQSGILLATVAQEGMIRVPGKGQ